MDEFNRKEPYNKLPALPPKGFSESVEIFRKTISASRALAQLNGAIVDLPTPNLFIDTLHLQEAKASSAIENIVTTNDELYRSAVSSMKEIDPATKEILGYREAIWFGLEQLENRPFITTNMCVGIMQRIKQNTMSIRKTPGTTLVNDKGHVVYTPPSGEEIIRTKLAELERFIHGEDELDPLVKMALLHYQFEAIHPFMDGNGRTGRILLVLYLKMSGLLKIPVIFLSSYILEHRNDYYKNLRGVTEHDDWENWILYMLDMIEQTSLTALKSMAQIRALMEDMSIEIKRALPKIHSKEMVEALFYLPYIKRQQLSESRSIAPKTAGVHLQALEEKGFLKGEMVGKEKLYLNFRLLEALEENE